jgi:hypothetical protein
VTIVSGGATENQLLYSDVRPEGMSNDAYFARYGLGTSAYRGAPVALDLLDDSRVVSPTQRAVSFSFYVCADVSNATGDFAQVDHGTGPHDLARTDASSLTPLSR